MSAFAAKAPTPPTATRVQHAADEAANATAIAANRKARLERRNAANLANDAARAKRLRDGVRAVRWDRVGKSWVPRA
jgi:hypothetical protein